MGFQKTEGFLTNPFFPVLSFFSKKKRTERIEARGGAASLPSKKSKIFWIRAGSKLVYIKL
jgi:hypothetical protein